MTRKDIIRMAQIVIEERGGSRMDDEEDLIAYSLQLAALVAAAENEACAGLAERRMLTDENKNRKIGYDHACKVIAEAIRARGQA
jgi:hypothetical protein